MFDRFAGVFQRIADLDEVVEFYKTPIHRFFTTRGVPGFDYSDEKILARNGMKTPMDVVSKFRKLMYGRNLPKNYRIFVLIEYFKGLGMIITRSAYTASVSLVLIERYAPRNGKCAL